MSEVVEMRDLPRRKPRPGEFRCQKDRWNGCEMIQHHIGECGSPDPSAEEAEDMLRGATEREWELAIRGDENGLGLAIRDASYAVAEFARRRLELDPADRTGQALALAHELTEPGVRRVVVIGDRRSRDPNDPSGPPSEPNLRGEDGIQAGIWDPRARSVYHIEPTHDGEETEFGGDFGGSVQGFSHAERTASYRTFLKVQRAIVEMTEATTPGEFLKKLGEAASHLGPTVARALEAKVAQFVQPQLAPADVADLEPEIEMLPEGEPV